MDLISSIILLGFLFLGYFYVRSKSEIKKEDKPIVKTYNEKQENIEKDMVNNNRIEIDTLDNKKITVPENAIAKNLSPLEKEAEKIDKEIATIKETVLNVVNNALYFEPMAKWKNEVIYKFIVSSKDVFEFEEFLTKENNIVGVSDKLLCFNQLSYKKIASDKVDELLKKFENMKSERIVLVDV